MDYGVRGSWDGLLATGKSLLAKFLAEEVPKITSVEGVEKEFQISISSLDLPLVGVIDLVAFVDGKRTLIDFKTASAKYEPHEVVLSDQLSAYQLASPDASQVALCVLLKTKEPKIEWHLTTRRSEDLRAFLQKLGIVASDIHASRFYRRAGKHCGWCDFLPLCLGNQVETTRTLVRVG